MYIHEPINISPDRLIGMLAQLNETATMLIMELEKVHTLNKETLFVAPKQTIVKIWSFMDARLLL